MKFLDFSLNVLLEVPKIFPFPKIPFRTPFQPLFEKVSKKAVGSKNDFSKSCLKFCKLSDNFFYFDEISKMRILEPKNVFFVGSEKKEIEKSSYQKMTFLKVVRNFAN